MTLSTRKNGSLPMPPGRLRRNTVSRLETGLGQRVRSRRGRGAAPLHETADVFPKPDQLGVVVAGTAEEGGVHRRGSAGIGVVVPFQHPAKDQEAAGRAGGVALVVDSGDPASTCSQS